MIKIHKNILNEQMWKLYSTFAEFKDDFYLAGGTGLALLMGHRMSIDFDFFSDKPIKKTLIKKIETLFPKYAKQVILNSSAELTIIIGQTKITFLHYPFKKILPLEYDNNISILSAKEILASKAYSIGRRGVYKDYVDLYYGLIENITTLSEIIKIASEKYLTAFNDRLFLEQLLYLEEIEQTEIIMIDHSLPSKKEMADFFSKKIAEIKI